MEINSSKCLTMIIFPFIRKQTVDVPRVLLGNNLLSTVDSIRIHGVEFCKNLSFVTHSNKVRYKMNCLIGIWKGSGRSVMLMSGSKSTMHLSSNIYIAYCLPGWSHLPKTSADHMEHCILIECCDALSRIKVIIAIITLA